MWTGFHLKYQIYWEPNTLVPKHMKLLEQKYNWIKIFGTLCELVQVKYQFYNGPN